MAQAFIFRAFGAETQRLLSRATSRRTAMLVMGVCLLVGGLGACSRVAAQRRNPPHPPRTVSPQRAAIDYSKFSHTTNKHQQACKTCHKLPTTNWQKVRDFPDTADYPDHDTCVGCHRPQFFKGARPVICTGCHLKSSPRDDARFAFRKPAMLRQFTIEFPHDKHQDVIASLPPKSGLPGRRTFLRSSRTLSAHALSANAIDDKTKLYNNCTICHASRAMPPSAPPSGWVDSFAPEAATFKSVPVNHASCFNCHWKSQPPVSTDCVGCHKLTVLHNAADSPARISMKFKHSREQHIAECTTCHINITKSATLRGLRPDVPITSCTECHNKDGLRLDVSKELEAVDKNRGFVCVYCHTSNVGRLDAPRSHYLIAGREPVTRKDLK